MDRGIKHYKFINSETDNVIYFLSFPENAGNAESVLEDTRKKLASEKGIFVGNIYYATSEDKDFDD